MKRVIIGYQGIENSNNHRAAKMIASELGFDSLELRPMVSSDNVVKALQCGEIEYGVMAFKTDVAGDVSETKIATEGLCYHVLHSVSFDIHHCLFKKNEHVEKADIKVIASHPEALRECRNTVSQLFPDAKMMEVEDTAYAAKALKEGVLPADTAVLCNMKAGLGNDLVLLKENLEDLEHNGTTFYLIQLRNHSA